APVTCPVLMMPTAPSTRPYLKPDRSGQRNKNLPNDDTLIFRQVQFIAFVDVESLVKSIHFDQRPYCPVLCRRMRVGLHLVYNELLGRFGPPDGCPRKEKPLLLGKPVNHTGVALFVEVKLKCVVSNRNATEVADVFTQRKTAIYIHARYGLVRFKLCRQRSSRLFKLRTVVVRPPVVQVAVPIVLRSAVVKP